MIYLSRKYKQKPRQWGPPSAVRAAVRDWFERRIGIPESDILAAIPLWHPGDQPDIGGQLGIGVNSGAAFTGDGLYFDGSAYVLFPAAGLSHGEDLTAFCVFHPDSTTQNSAVVSQAEARNYFRPFWAAGVRDLGYDRRDNYVWAETNGEVDPAAATFDSAEQSHAWIFVDGGYLTVYNRGDEIGSGSIGTQASYYSGGQICVGARRQMDGTTSYRFFGKIKALYLFRTALSADQIAALHADPYGALRRRPMPFFSFAASSNTSFNPSWAQNATVTVPYLGV